MTVIFYSHQVHLRRETINPWTVSLFLRVFLHLHPSLPVRKKAVNPVKTFPLSFFLAFLASFFVLKFLGKFLANEKERNESTQTVAAERRGKEYIINLDSLLSLSSPVIYLYFYGQRVSLPLFKRVCSFIPLKNELPLQRKLSSNTWARIPNERSEGKWCNMFQVFQRSRPHNVEQN